MEHRIIQGSAYIGTLNSIAYSYFMLFTLIVISYSNYNLILLGEIGYMDHLTSLCLVKKQIRYSKTHHGVLFNNFLHMSFVSLNSFLQV